MAPWGAALFAASIVVGFIGVDLLHSQWPVFFCALAGAHLQLSVRPAADQRVRVGNVKAKSTLTKDTVQVSVGAVNLWVVWNGEECRFGCR